MGHFLSPGSRSRLWWAIMMLLHSSLGNRGRPCLFKKINRKTKSIKEEIVKVEENLSFFLIEPYTGAQCSKEPTLGLETLNWNWQIAAVRCGHVWELKPPGGLCIWVSCFCELYHQKLNQVLEVNIREKSPHTYYRGKRIGIIFQYVGALFTRSTFQRS